MEINEEEVHQSPKTTELGGNTLAEFRKEGFPGGRTIGKKTNGSTRF